MDRNDVNRLWQIFLYDKFLQALSFALFFIILLTTIFFGLVSGISVSLAYCGGIFLFCSFLRCDFEISKIIHFVSAVITFKSHTKENTSVQKSCNVCGDANCSRDKVVHKQKPWVGLSIPIEIDDALEKLLEKTIETYVESWYQSLSSDVAFLTEIRETIRYAASVVLSRLLKVDLTELLTTKLFPAVINHIEMGLQLKVRPDFHPALYNRKAELDYVRLRVKYLLPHLIEERNLKCNLFSTLIIEILSGWLLLPIGGVSDVTVLNNLLLYILSDKQLAQYPQVTLKKVPFLESFVKKQSLLESNSLALHPDMCTILKEQSLLYAFMQFLKEQNAVHILQFCLDVEEFNKRMLTPELSSEQLDSLHRDAWDLFSVYFSPHSPDSIGFGSDLVSQMRKLISKDVTKLRTSRPLFQAYEHAYSLLDNNYCPLFHTSDEFYTWLCGPRTPCSFSISGSSSPSAPGSPSKNSVERRSGSSRLSHRLHKIKGALKQQTVLEGTALDTDVLQLEGDTEFAEDLTLMEDEEEERDLSSWRVRVREVGYKMDTTAVKNIPFYLLVVQRIDPMQGIIRHEWCVERKLTDFYALEAKLTEFHGDFPDSQLPPCGLLAPSPPTEPFVYESYLQKLLVNPSLRGSDLLHWFLSAPEFTLEENALGRLLRKSVPITLRKERGQNIESFISTFFVSTDSKPKSKLEWREYNCEVSPRRVRSLLNTVFGDNLGIPLNAFPDEKKAKSSKNVLTIKGPADCLIYCGVRLLSLPDPLVRLSLAVHSLLQKPIDSLCKHILDVKLRALLVPKRVAHLISLLQWVLFEKNTKTDPKEVSAALSEKIGKLKGFSHTFYESIFMILQNPLVNKQLYYVFFDIILEELFPEKTSNYQNNEKQT